MSRRTKSRPLADTARHRADDRSSAPPRIWASTSVALPPPNGSCPATATNIVTPADHTSHAPPLYSSCASTSGAA